MSRCEFERLLDCSQHELIPVQTCNVALQEKWLAHARDDSVPVLCEILDCAGAQLFEVRHDVVQGKCAKMSYK